MAMHPEVIEALSRSQSPLHDKLLTACRARIRASERRFNTRHDSYRESETLLRSFRTPDAEDKQMRKKSLTEGMTKIVVPYTYAQVYSVLAYLMTMFTERKPIFPVEPVGDYQKAAIIHEHLIEYQLDQMRPRGNMIMLQALLDALRYDCGIIKNIWTIREFPDWTRVMFTGPEGEQIDELIEEDVISYEGNEALNVSPFDFYPDPSRTMGDYQKGEFVAHRMKRSPMEIEQKAAEGMYVGTEFISKASQDGRSGDTFSPSGTSALGSTVGMAQDYIKSPIDEYDKAYTTIHEMWWFCHPKQLGLPSNRTRDLPSLWVFTIANMNRIIRAEPANLPGRRFPFAMIQLNYDIHSPATPSMVETTAGLQYHLNFLINSRMAAVRKTLNNELVIDPHVIESVDWEQPNPSGIWRVSKDFYGTGAARDAVFPLPVQDVTAGHWNDFGQCAAIFDDVTGANRTLRGMSNTGRRSATETQSQMSCSGGRMQLHALGAAHGFSEWGEIMVANTKTFLTERLQLPVNQAYRDILGMEMMNVTPELLQGSFRVPFLEGGIPTDKAFHVNTLKDMLTPWMQSPAAMGLLQRINGIELYIQMLRLLGIKNVQDYVITEVQPDAMVQQQMAQGNLIPAGQGPQEQASDGFPVQTNAPNTGTASATNA